MTEMKLCPFYQMPEVSPNHCDNQNQTNEKKHYFQFPIYSWEHYCSIEIHRFKVTRPKNWRGTTASQFWAWKADVLAVRAELRKLILSQQPGKLTTWFTPQKLKKTHEFVTICISKSRGEGRLKSRWYGSLFQVESGGTDWKTRKWIFPPEWNISTSYPWFYLVSRILAACIVPSSLGLVVFFYGTLNSLEELKVMTSGLPGKTSQPDHRTVKLLFPFSKPCSGAKIFNQFIETHALLWVGNKGSPNIWEKPSM